MNLLVPQEDLAFLVRLAHPGAQYAFVKYIKETRCIDSDRRKYIDFDTVDPAKLHEDGVYARVYVKAVGKDGRMYERKLADFGKNAHDANLMAGGLTLEWSK